MANTSIKLASYGTYGLHLAKNPAGTWSFVGTIPVELLVEKTGKFGKQYDSPCFVTEQLGIDYFNEHRPDKPAK